MRGVGRGRFAGPFLGLCAQEGGQGGEGVQIKGVAVHGAGVHEALQIAALVVEGRGFHGEGAAFHDGPEGIAGLGEAGEHAQGFGPGDAYLKAVRGAGVAGEAQAGGDAFPEQGAFFGAGLGVGVDEALAAFAHAAGEMEQARFAQERGDRGPGLGFEGQGSGVVADDKSRLHDASSPTGRAAMAPLPSMSSVKPGSSRRKPSLWPPSSRARKKPSPPGTSR